MIALSGSTTRRLACAATALAVTMVSVVACSSSGSNTQSTDAASPTSATSDTCTTKAQGFLKPYETLPTTLPSTFQPLSQAPKKGGLIIKLAQGAVAADVQSAQAQAQAAAAIGWTGKMISYDGSISDLNAKFNQALQEKPDIIAMASVDPDAIKSDLAAAKTAGVIVSISGSPDALPSGYPGYSAGSFGPDVFDQEADIAANFALVDSGCKVDAAVATLSGISTQQSTAKRIGMDLTSCGSCSSTQVNILPTDLGSPQATTAIVSALQAHPNINYLIATLGNITDGLSAALKQAGLGKVKIINIVPDTDTMKGLQAGDIAACVNLSVVLNGWIELYAGLASQEEKSTSFINGFPLSLLTPQNVSKTSTALPSYPSDYPSLFKALWKISS